MADDTDPTDAVRAMQITFGSVTVLSVVGLLVAPGVGSTPVFLAGFFALFSACTLQRALRRGVERGLVPRRAVVPALVVDLAASALLGYLAGTLVQGWLLG
ncbi:hypothetical protein [Puerhibacterium puerhi]|uniref:hypothetical protein n=1 Tax=Puerhibacterium puerhi TaxID=2692623 RepID=UPI00135745C5|nr:hypothetical protein [Puerhibacterium puerhi]